jgi:hypothetical protein
VLDPSLLLPRPHKRRERLSRFHQLMGLNQKQFSIAQLEKRFTALWIGALTQHLRFTAFCSSSQAWLSARMSFQVQVNCQSSPSFRSWLLLPAL